MKIGCLQFAPRVGDVSNNLDRADSILNKLEDANDLDLLVLPELAFTGYNFHSLAEISPFLEPSASGTSSLWARTTALKLNCNVVIGYPEKVDVTETWPASPEFYNSAAIVSRDGEVVGNYRKSFLYATDETWALEGPDGFFECYFPDLGNVAMGICMDINPYKFEAPWDAFEFAFHVLEVQANLVIVTMAWLTREDPHVYTQSPHEPDMETLGYWIQRLEPIIHRENDEETIAVFCNRTGIEDDCVYAGTSAVFGIKNGEVNLYGVLGRGVRELLVVDTEAKPFAKVVQADTVKTNAVRAEDKGTAPQPQPQEPKADLNHEPASSATAPFSGTSSDGTQSQRSSVYLERCEEWEFMSDFASAGSTPSVTSQTFRPPAKSSLQKSRFQQTVGSQPPSASRDWNSPINAIVSLTQGDEDVPTPIASNQKPVSFGSTSGFDKIANSIKVPSAETRKAITPMAEAPLGPLRGTIDHYDLMTERHHVNSGGQPDCYEADVENSVTSHERALYVSAAPAYNVSWRQTVNAPFDMTDDDDVEISTDDECEENDDEDFAPSFTSDKDIFSDVKQELGSIFANNLDKPSISATPNRPQSTKSRNASRPRLHNNDLVPSISRSISQLQISHSRIASPGTFANQSQPTASPDLPLYFRPDSNFGSRSAQAPESRQAMHKQQQQSVRSTRTRLDSPMVHTATSLPFSRDANRAKATTPDTGMSPMQPRQATTRQVSRGRQPFSKLHPTNGDGASSLISTGARQFREDSLDRGRLQANGQSAHLRDWLAGDVPTARTDRATSVASSVSWLFGTPPPPSASQSAIDADDEIVAVISRVDGSCPVHRHGSQPSGLVTLSRNQSRQQQSQDDLRLQSRPASGTPDRHQMSQPQNTPAADSVYEITLPPKIRELVESLSSGRKSESPLRSTDVTRGRSTTKFNPPTPKAMVFTNNEDDEALHFAVSTLKVK